MSFAQLFQCKGLASASLCKGEFCVNSSACRPCDGLVSKATLETATRLRISVRAVVISGRMESTGAATPLLAWVFAARDVVHVEISSDRVQRPATASGEVTERTAGGTEWKARWDTSEATLSVTRSTTISIKVLLSCSDRWNGDTLPYPVGEVKLKIDSDVLPLLADRPEPIFPLVCQLRPAGWVQLNVAAIVDDRPTGCKAYCDPRELRPPSSLERGAMVLPAYSVLGDRCQKLREFTLHADAICACAIFPRGDTVLTVSRDRKGMIWDAGSGAEMQRLVGHEDWVLACQVFPSGDRVLTGSADGSVVIWDVNTGSPLCRLEGHDGPVRACCVLEAELRVLTASADKSARVWQLSFPTASAQQLLRFQEHTGEVNDCAVFSSGSPRVLTVSDDGCGLIWHPDTGQQILKLEGHSGHVYGCAVLPDERVLTVSQDRSGIIWDACTGAQLVELIGHQGAVRSCAAFASGRYVLTASEDRSATVWDVNSGVIVAQGKGHTAPLFGCATFPSDDLFITCSEDSTAVLWKLELTDDTMRSNAISSTGGVAMHSGSPTFS